MGSVPGTPERYYLTPGQWAALSPDYRRVTYDTQGYPELAVLAVNLDTLATELVPVTLTDSPPPAPVPPHYADIWPVDPRD